MMENDETNKTDITKRLIIIGLGLGAIFWIIESFLEIFLFQHRSNFLHYMFPPDTHLIWHRSIVIVLLVILFVFSYFTINKLKKSMEAYKQERDKAQKYLDIAGVIFLVLDTDQGVSLINKKGSKVLGYKEDEIKGKNWIDNFLPARIREDVKVVFDKLVTGEIMPVEYYENPVLTRTGEERIIAWHNTVIKDESGKIINVLSSGEDITDRKRAEEDRMLLLDNMSAMVWYLKDEQTHGAVNRALADFMGVKKTDIEHKSLFEIFRKEEAEICIEGNKKVFADKKSINTEEWVVNAEGEPRLLAITKTPRLAEDGNVEYMVCSAIDITERKKAEEYLQEQERFLSSIFSSIQDLLCVTDKDLNILRVNSAVEKMLSHAMPLIGRKCYEAFHGRSEPCEICPTLRTLESGTAQSNVITLKNNNEIIRWFDVHSFPLTDLERGEIEGVIEYARDITDRKKAEQELIRMEKLSSLGKMLAGIGHEIKNPLSGIGMMLSSIKGSFRQEDSRREDITRILKEIRKLETMLDNVVKFSRPKPLLLEKLDITTPLENSLVLIKKALKDKNITLEKMYGHNRLRCPIDSESMQQVFMNLFLNAIESMSNNGILNIGVHEANHRQFREPGIQVIIKDTGCGIGKENIEKIFDPYFTTNSRKTGLGLYISYQIVSAHRGMINVNSTEGVGTTFDIYLPQH